MSTCAIHPSARAVTAILSTTDSSVNEGTISRQIYQLIESGYMTAEEVESTNAYHLAEVLSEMAADSLGVDISFKDRGSLIVRSAEQFSGDGARSRYATNYIGYGVKGRKMAMEEAYAKGGRPLVGDLTNVGPDTVAVVEMTTSSDFLATWAACKRVLDAGGRLLLPTRAEVQEYAGGIKSEANRKAYESLHRELESRLAKNGYSVRDSKEAGGRVVQKTGEVTIDRLSFASTTKAGKIKAASDGLSEEQVKAKVDEAKSWRVSAGSTFESKEGGSLRADGVTAPTLYDAIVAGEVDSIAKSDTANNKYSELRSGDVLCLSKDSTHMVYVEVVGVTPNIAKDQYIGMLKSGEATTGYSVESAAGMRQDALLSVVKIKPIAERTIAEKESGKKDKGGKKTSEDHKGQILVWRKNRKGQLYRKWVNAKNSGNSESKKEISDLMKMMVSLNLALLRKEAKGGTVVIDDGTGPKEMTVEAAVDLVQKEYIEGTRQDGKETTSKTAAAKKSTDTSDAISNDILHTEIKVNVKPRHSMQTDVFGGSYYLTEQFGKSLAGKFIERCDEVVIPLKINQYKAAIEECRRRIKDKSLPLSRSERNALSQKVKALNAKIAAIEEDGWLAAVRTPDLLNATVLGMLSVMREAGSISRDLYDYRAEADTEGKSLDEIYAAFEKSENGRKIDDEYRDLLNYDQREGGIKFLESIEDGYLDYTDAEWRAELEAEGDTESLAEWDSRTEDEVRAGREEDADIMRRRAVADILRADAVRLMLKELSDIVGVKLSYDTKVSTQEEDKEEGNAAYTVETAIESVSESEDDESEEDAEASDEANDAETNEESEKDIQMTASYERDISDSLSKQVKRILGTQLEWWVKYTPLTDTVAKNNTEALRVESDPDITIVRDENGNAVAVKKFHRVRDGVFNSPKRVSAGVVYNHLLRIVNGYENVRGLYSGEELYQYLKKNQELLPWAHGIVLEMEKDAGVKAAIWVAMRNTHINMRSMRKGTIYSDRQNSTDWVSVAENYGESAKAMAAQAQTHVSTGTVLSRGVVERKGKPVRVQVSRSKGKPGNASYYNIVGRDVALHDMSMYNENGGVNQGGLEYEEDGKGGKTLNGASGAYALAFFMDDVRGRVREKEFDELVKTGDPIVSDLVTALRAVGIDTTETALVSAFTLEPKKYHQCLFSLQRLANQSVDQFYSGKHDKILYGRKPAYDFHAEDYNQLGNAISGLAESGVMSSVVWGSRQYYSWAHRSYIDDLVDGLGSRKGYDTEAEHKKPPIERDRDVLPFISKLTGFNFEHPELSPDLSFLYRKEANGEPVMLNTILRDLMESQNDDEDSSWSAQEFREEFTRGFFHSLGFVEDRNDVTDVKSMSVAQKVAVEIQAFFSPKDGNNKGISADYAQYAVPIMADSKNHVFSVGRRYQDRALSTGDLVRHGKGGFLYDCANVVMQEFFRIKAFKSNTINGKPISRPRLSKTYERNAGKFCYFTSLNEVEVSIDGIRMPFIDALEGMFAGYFDVDGDIGSITIHYKGKDYAVPRTDGVEWEYSLMMEAVQQTYLNESYHRSMEAWRKAGCFEVGSHETSNMGEVEGYTYLESDDGDTNDFKIAYDQHKRRLDARDAATIAMAGREFTGVAGFKRTEDGRVTALMKRSVQNGEETVEVAMSHPAWRELESYEDASRGIRRGDLLWYFTEMGDELFLEHMYDMNYQEREVERERVKAIAAEVARVMGQYSDKKDDALGKVVESINHITSDASTDVAYSNLFVQYMHEYAWNKVLYKMEISQLLVGDAAQFKNEAELSKRAKGYAAAYERCDLSAVDTLSGTHKGQLVKDFYGESRIQGDKYRENQKTFTVRDIKGGGEKAGRSSFFEKELHPLLVRDLEAGLITEQEYVDFCESFRDMNVTDGQSFRTLESMVKLLNFLHLNTPAIQAVYDAVVIEHRELTWDETRAALQQIKSVAYGFQTKEIRYEENGQVKTYLLNMADFVKDSEFTLMMYTEQMARYLGDEVGRSKHKAGEAGYNDYGGKRSILQGILDFARENQVDVIHFESTKKTGESNIVDISDCETADEVRKRLTDEMNAAWTEEQKSAPDFEENKHDERAFPRDPATDIFHAEPWANMGRQVPTPPHLMDKEQGVGTQIEKLIEADIPEEWTSSTDEIDPATGKPRVRTYKTEVTLRDDDGKPIMRLSPEQYRDLLARIKLTNLLSAARKLDKQLESKEELSKLLLSQLRSTDKYSEDLVNMFSINPETGDFNMPLDNPVAIQAMQPILSSYIRKRVIKQKTKGGTAIQFSSVGKTQALKSVFGVDEKTGQKYVKYVECMLPAWSKALFTAFADENGEIDIDKIPPSLTSMVGYRVPTEHMYSMVPLRVVGFLNEAQGTSIMLPQEITVWSGSDFDIDKLYLEIPEFKVKGRKEVLDIASDKAWNGFYKEHPATWSDIVELWRRAAAQYLENNSGVLSEGDKARVRAIADDPASVPVQIFKAFRKQYCSLAGIGQGRMFDILAIHDPKKLDGLREAFNDYLEKNGLLDEYVETEGDRTKALLGLVDEEGHLSKEGADIQSLLDGMSQMERNNLLVKLHHARLTSDFSLMQINRPGGFTAQKRMARMVTVLQNSDERGYEELRDMPLDELGELSDEYSGDLRMFDAAVDDMMFERNMIGSSMIGICALHNTLHAVVQKKPVSLSKEFVDTYGFTLDGKPMRATLGDVSDESGRSILLNIGGFLSAAVDNAKDPVLGFLNLTPTTADVFLSFLHMGYSIETTSLLMNQPIIKAAAKLGSRFERHITSLCSDMEIKSMTGDGGALDMTHEAMAAGLRLKGGEAELLRDPVQRNALYIVNTMLKVSNAIKTLQEANNVTSSNKNIAPSPGENIKRMSPALYATGRNQCYVKAGDKGYTIGQVFDDGYYAFLRDDTSTTGELHDVEYYMQAQESGTMTQPFVQACYDIGFRWAMDKLSRYSSQYSRDVVNVVDAINRKFGNTDAIRLKDSFINQIVRELRTFRTVDAFAAEEIRKGYTVQQARAVILRDFPKQYSKILNYNREQKGRDLQKEFAILGHIVNAKAKKDKISYLKFVANGKIDKALQNELTSSWLRLATDSDPELCELAVNLYKYAFYFNGGNFSPIAFGSYCPAEVLQNFTEYNERLRELPDIRMSTYGDADMVDRFVDQFIRNHTNMKSVKRLIGSFRCPAPKDGQQDISDVFFEKKEGYKGRTRLVPRKSFSFEFKSHKVSSKEYVMIYPNGESEGYLYHKVGDGIRDELKYVRADVLGDNNSSEYDPESDLCEHVSSYAPASTGGPVTENGALGMSKRQAEEQRKYGEEVLAKLKDINSRLIDDRSGKGGNDSKGYKLDGMEGMRVHQYMENKLDCKGVPKPDRYTDAEWERLKADGTAIGSAVDFYGRTYLDLLTRGEPLEEYHLASISRGDKLDRTLLGKKDRDRLALVFTKLGELWEAGIDTRIDTTARDGRILTKHEFMDRKFHHVLRAMIDDKTIQLQPGDRIIEGFRYKDENGNETFKSIRLFANVTTMGGENLNIGGEIDWLIAHADGSFSILDLKTVKDSGVSYLTDPTGSTYQTYAKQLNTYRSLLLAMFPKAKVRGLYIVPFVTSRTVTDSKGNDIGDYNKRVPDPSKGERTLLTDIQNLDEYTGRGLPYIEVPVDPKLSGIDEPDEVAPKAVSATPTAQAKPAASPAPSQGASAAKASVAAPTAKSPAPAVRKAAQPKALTPEERDKQMAALQGAIDIGFYTREEAMAERPDLFYSEKDIAAAKYMLETGAIVPERLEATRPGILSLINGETAEPAETVAESPAAPGGQSQGDGFNSYKEILVAALGEDAANAIYDEYSILDGVPSKDDIEDMEASEDEGRMTKEQLIQRVLDDRTGLNRKGKPYIAGSLRFSNKEGRFDDILSKGDDFFIELGEAILNHKRIKDDEGNTLC